MARVVLILGTNKGDKNQNIIYALNHLSQEIGNIVKESHLYASEAWGMDNLPENENTFFNKAIVIETKLLPLQILDKLQQIEAKMGRTHDPQKRYSSRIIDIDILFYDNKVYNYKRLTIPHIEIANRKFVLEPLKEIIPDFVHPVLNQKISALSDLCKDVLTVSKIS